MIFSCARCETRYKLPDDKVTNRVVKVRCRRCGVIIVVRDPSRPQSASVETEAVWFAAIDGEQRGPLTSGALQQLVESGVLTSATFVWKVGMGDWLAAQEVPEISALIQSIGPPPIPVSETTTPASSAPEIPLEAIPEMEDTLSAGAEPLEVQPSSTEVSGDDATLATESATQDPVAALDELPGPWSEAESGDVELDETIVAFDESSGLDAEPATAEVADAQEPSSDVELVNAPSAPGADAAAADMELDETIVAFDESSGLDAEPATAEVADAQEPSTDVELMNAPSAPGADAAAADMELDETIVAFDGADGSQEQTASPTGEVVEESSSEAELTPPADSALDAEGALEAPSAPEPAPEPTPESAATSPATSDVAEPETQESDAEGERVSAAQPTTPGEAPDTEGSAAALNQGPVEDGAGVADAPTDAVEEAPDATLLEDAPARAPEPPAHEDTSTPAPDSDYAGGLGDEDPTLKIQRPDLSAAPSSSSRDDAATVQDVEAAPSDDAASVPAEEATPESLSDSPEQPEKIDPLAPAVSSEGPDAGPATRVEPLPVATIDTQAAGAPPSQDMATQPETEAAPPAAGSMELAEDLFAGIEGAMNTEDLKKMAAPKPLSTLDLIQAPDLQPEPEATEEDKAFFKQAMRSGGRVQAMSITAVQAVDKSELNELRKEFGVVGELEAARRKRKIIALVTIVAVVSGVVGAISLYQSQRQDLKDANRIQFAADDSSVPVADHRAVYDSAKDEVDEAEQSRIAAEEAKAEEADQKRLADEKQARADKWESQKAYMAEKRAKKAEDSRKKYNKISASDYKKLMTDSSGKSEVKLKFSARDQADKAAKKAAAKRKKKGDVRASEVVATFGRKRRQLARCKSGEDEKVRAQFTVAPNGRVTGVKVTGTQSSQKRDCVKGILKQAIFPKGPETNTYAMPFTL